MSNIGFKGVNVRQTGSQLVFRAFLQSSTGTLIVAGTTNFYLMELQSDGTIKTYDFNDNTFKTTACTTENLAGAYKKSNNAGTDTGIWTAVISTLTGFTKGAIYLVRVNNSTASPTDQIREFQYGSVEGDLATTANGTGTDLLNAAPDWGHVLNATTTVGLTGTTIATSQVVASVTGSVGSVTGLTASNLDVAVSTRLATAGYTSPSNLTVAQIATGIWTDTTASDFTTALSVGKSVMNGVTLGTGLTIASVSGAVGSVTGSVGSVVGSVGSVTGLTASNLDATITSRMATYTQPTGFLAATFPSGTIANTSNITTVGAVSGSVGSVTGAVGSVTAGVTVTTNDDKTGYALTQAFPTNFSVLAITAVNGKVTVGTNSDKTGYALSGTTTTFDALQTALSTSHGAGSWATATGFSTLVATDIVSNGAIQTNSGDIVNVRNVDTVSNEQLKQTSGVLWTYNDQGNPIADLGTLNSLVTEVGTSGNSSTIGGAIDIAISEANAAHNIVANGTYGNQALETLITNLPNTGLASNAQAAAILDWLEADLYVDKNTVPWSIVYMRKGTGGLGIGIEILRKSAYDVNGANLTSTDTVVGQLVGAGTS